MKKMGVKSLTEGVNLAVHDVNEYKWHGKDYLPKDASNLSGLSLYTALI